MKDMLLTLLKDNWPAVKAALIAILAGAIANVLNAMLASADANTSKLGRLLRWLLDHSPTFLSQKDSPGTLKMPFVGSHSPKRLAYHAKKNSPPAIPPAVLLPFLLLALPSCACFGPDAQQTKACAVLHQVIDCTVGSVKGLLPSLTPALMALINSGSPDWDAVLANLEGAGFKDAGCIVAALENDFVSKAAMPAASPEHMAKVGLARSKLAGWREKKYPGIKFKLHGGKVVG